MVQMFGGLLLELPGELNMAIMGLYSQIAGVDTLISMAIRDKPWVDLIMTNYDQFVDLATVIHKVEERTQIWSDNTGVPTDEIKTASIYFLFGKLHRGRGLPAIGGGRITQFWVNGELHRDGDKPAYISWLCKKYYQRGKLHRIGGPALRSDGAQEYYFEGKLHRDNDEPAVIIRQRQPNWGSCNRLNRIPEVRPPEGLPPQAKYKYTYKHYQHGVLHRIGGPAIIADDCEEYWENGERHRDGDLPACVSKIHNIYYKRGKRHRIGGPADEITGRNWKRTWVVDDVITRADGPAIEDQYSSTWVYNGHKIAVEEKVVERARRYDDLLVEMNDNDIMQEIDADDAPYLWDRFENDPFRENIYNDEANLEEINHFDRRMLAAWMDNGNGGVHVNI